MRQVPCEATIANEWKTSATVPILHEACGPYSHAMLICASAYQTPFGADTCSPLTCFPNADSIRSTRSNRYGRMSGAFFSLSTACWLGPAQSVEKNVMRHAQVDTSLTNCSVKVSLQFDSQPLQLGSIDKLSAFESESI
jgi:hypothetical protein